MRLKHHIILYTFLGAAVLIAIFLTLDFDSISRSSSTDLTGSFAVFSSSRTADLFRQSD